MNTENDHEYFNCYLNHETKKAWIVRLKHNSSQHVVPKSLCELGTTSGGAAPFILEVESWFADKEGMNDK